MTEIRSLTLREVRCFAGEVSGEVRRVTVLVGENSTGKSTFLGCFRTFAVLARLWELDDENYFDRPPFRMGGFDTIARRGTEEFSVTGSLRGRPGTHSDSLFGLAFRRGARPDPLEQTLSLGVPSGAGGSGELCLERVGCPERWRLAGPGFAVDLDASSVSYRQFTSWLSRTVAMGHLSPAELLTGSSGPASVVPSDTPLGYWKIANFLRRAVAWQKWPEVIAPEPTLGLRERQYPAHPLSAETKHLMEGIGEFGTKVGLFTGIEVRKSGAMEEVLVEMPDGWRNLADVGYGVHAVVPLLREMQRVERPTVFLLQEPERHLHPRAQAELAQLMAESPHHFLVETHSDHLVDRLRICAMRGQLDPEDLHLLYFEPTDDGDRSSIHDIAVDEMGNLLGAPPGYRDFFQRETERLMGFDEPVRGSGDVREDDH